MLATAAAEPGPIHWSKESRVLIQPGGQYGRMARVSPRSLICAFTWRRAIHVRLSGDEGRSWGEPVKVAEWNGGSLTNAELLVRKNGEIFCLFNRRPSRDRLKDASAVTGSPERYGIAASRSRDGGKSWSPTVVLYQAGSDFKNGCWEPAGLELPDGELQIYFANEGPYTASDEQEISLLRSRDDGKTWTGPDKVSFRAGHRDGMPVPVLTRDGRSIFMAIEDNGLSGIFKPVIISAPVASDAWRNGPVEAKSPQRVAAMKTPLAAGVYAGAPFLREIPGRRFVLSFQLAQEGDIKHSKMAVCIGDAECRNFGEPQHPFPDGTSAQLWNALFVKNSKVITAITEATLDGQQGIWTIDGEIR